MTHAFLISEVRNTIPQLQDLDSRHVIALTLDSGGDPIAMLLDTTDDEATSEPYCILVDHDDDLTDETLADSIDYDHVIAGLKEEWTDALPADKLIERVSADGYPEEVAREVIGDYTGPGMVTIDGVTYLNEVAKNYLTGTVKEWRGDQLSGQEAAKEAGIAWSTWRDYVADGRAPQRDGVLGSTSWWWEISVRRWMLNRPGQGVGGGRPRKG